MVSGERTLLPTPPGGGSGTTVLAADQDLPRVAGELIGLSPRATERLIDWIAAGHHLELAGAPGPTGGSRSADTAGGDDVIVATGDEVSYKAIDIASNGDIYVVAYVESEGAPSGSYVYRSKDGGDTWTDWGFVDGRIPCIHVAEGVANRCFVAAAVPALGGNYDVVVAASDLSLEVGDFSAPVVVMSHPDVSFYSSSSLTSDAGSFNYYYLYLVAAGNDDTEYGIWFARSVNQGASFEDAYAIATVDLPDRYYLAPTVAYGFGGYVHVAWYLDFTPGDYDAALRYRRAANYAGGGLASWGSILGLTPTSNGIFEASPSIAASATSGQVVISYMRFEDGVPGYLRDSGVLASSDQGQTFPASVVLDGGVDVAAGIEQQTSTGDWILAGGRSVTYSAVLQRSDGSDVTTWSGLEVLGDRAYHYGDQFTHFCLALDPSRSDQAAVAWSTMHFSGGLDSLLFDAEWRGGSGYPNLEEGFPLDLQDEAVSPPAVVDLDGDGDLEIVFGDSGGRIQVFHHTGDAVAGWPVAVGAALSPGPVAIGDLEGNGTLLVLAGTTDGRGFAYRADGSLAPGWPFVTGQAGHAFISIGPLGGPNPRMAALCAGERLYFLDDSGDPIHGFYWHWPGETFAAPVAIGDVDGDGVAEAVGGVGDRVFAVHAAEATSVFGRIMPAAVSGAPTLGDFDLDDDVEVVVPLEDGSLYLLQGDGADAPGDWPFVSPTGSRLSSAAIANCLGGGAPEIAVAARDWTVHLLWADGFEQSGYPVTTAGWRIYGSPVMGFLEDPYSADVVVGARGYRGWAWDNFGALVPGWPRTFAGNIYQSPAMGDLDLDGRTEIVFVAEQQLVVLDVNQVPSPPERGWPMHGYDPQRTGCAACPEPPGGDVGEPLPEPTACVRLSLPVPNPAGCRTTLAYALPSRAQVRIDICDVLGRCLATVHRSEMEAGEYRVVWEGRNDQGVELPSGRYLVRLQARGPGVDETIVRPVTLVR